MNISSFESAVHGQIDLLNDGQPLEALDQYFALDGLMYSNDQLFATGKDQARQKQEHYILAAQSIKGRIEDLKTDAAHQVCIFRNCSSFVLGDGSEHQIDGLCWQQWSDGKVEIERYFDAEMMAEHLLNGLVQDPARLAALAG